MNNRRILAICLALMMVFSLTACGKKPVSASENTVADVDFDVDAYMKDVVLQMTSSLSELAASDNFISLMVPMEDVKNQVKTWGMLEIDRDKPIVVVPTSADMMSSYIDQIADSSELASLSDSEKSYLYSRIGQNLPTLFNSKAGSSTLAAASAITYSRTYVPAGQVPDQAWFVPTNTNAYYFVSFTNTGDGAVTAYATYVVSDDDIIATMKDYLQSNLGCYEIIF